MGETLISGAVAVVVLLMVLLAMWRRGTRIRLEPVPSAEPGKLLGRVHDEVTIDGVHVALVTTSRAVHSETAPPRIEMTHSVVLRGELTNPLGATSLAQAVELFGARLEHLRKSPFGARLAAVKQAG